MKRSEEFKKDSELLEKIIDQISNLPTKIFKDADGRYIVNTENPIRELLWLQHNLKKWMEIYKEMGE